MRTGSLDTAASSVSADGTSGCFDLAALLFLLIFVISFLATIGCNNNPTGQVLAEVNGQKITTKHFEAEIAKVPEDMRLIYRNRPEDLLDRLISLVLLLQEAKSRGLVASSSLEQLYQPAIQTGLKQIVAQTVRGEEGVSDEEIAVFYQQHKEQMGGRPLSELREPIRQAIASQKGQAAMGDLLNRLRARAQIAKYEQNLPKPSPPALEPSTATEFETALKSGKPVVVDFGSGHCIPCIRLRPELRAVKDAHEKSVHVMFLEINDNRKLARRYRVQLIPTVIFFDASGREVARHMGYMERSAIENVLREKGLLGG